MHAPGVHSLHLAKAVNQPDMPERAIEIEWHFYTMI